MPVRSGSGNIQVNPYPVSSSESAIYAGDICVMTSKNTVKSGSTATGSADLVSVIGVAAMNFAANAGSTTITTQNTCLIYDDPAQLFTMCDSSSGVTNSSGVGLAFKVVGTGPASFSSTTLSRSVMALCGGTGSSAGTVKLVGIHPVEMNNINVYATGTTGTANVRKWIVSLTNHIMQTGGSTTLLTT